MGLGLYILIFVTVLGHGAHAQIPAPVNKALQETQSQIDSEQGKKKNLAIPKPVKHPSQVVGPNENAVKTIDVTPLTPEEQFNVGDRPRGGHIKEVDLEEPINEEVKRKQDFDKYKKNYKKALMKEVENQRGN